MSEKYTQQWIAPKTIRLPDFIICGAMKCGTSTVHNLLGKHPEIYIPDSEINFFDIDDIFQHSDFYSQRDGRFLGPDISIDPIAYWEWYHDFFRDAPKSNLIGEDSTCYLPSARASQRISLQSKPIKTIICLRQPSLRAYSQYWHMLRTGRAMFNFEDTIKFTPNHVLERSMYLSQIKDFMRHIPKDRIFFFILEEFLRDKEAVAQKLLDFLSLDYGDLPENALETHSNIGTLPRNIELQAFKNRMLRAFGNVHYAGRLPLASEAALQRTSYFPRAVNKLHNMVNPTKLRSIPKMNTDTKTFLDGFFIRELEGLADIVGADINQLWFPE